MKFNSGKKKSFMVKKFELFLSNTEKHDPILIAVKKYRNYNWHKIISNVYKKYNFNVKKKWKGYIQPNVKKMQWDLKEDKISLFNLDKIQKTEVLNIKSLSRTKLQRFYRKILLIGLKKSKGENILRIKSAPLLLIKKKKNFMNNQLLNMKMYFYYLSLKIKNLIREKKR